MPKKKQEERRSPRITSELIPREGRPLPSIKSQWSCWCVSWCECVCVCVSVGQCVCVCPPLDKGFPPPPFASRGMERTRGAPSNEAPHVLLGYHQGRLMTYLQSTVAHAVHSFWFDSWFFMCYFPKTAFSRLCIAASRASETFFQQFKSLDLFALLFHHLPSQRVTCIN